MPVTNVDVKRGQSIAACWLLAVLALAAALDGLLSDSHRAATLGERAARRAANEYDVSRMVQTYATLYEELLTNDTSMTLAAVGASPAGGPTKVGPY